MDQQLRVMESATSSMMAHVDNLDFCQSTSRTPRARTGRIVTFVSGPAVRNAQSCIKPINIRSTSHSHSNPRASFNSISAIPNTRSSRGRRDLQCIQELDNYPSLQSNYAIFNQRSPLLASSPANFSNATTNFNSSYSHAIPSNPYSLSQRIKPIYTESSSSSKPFDSSNRGRRLKCNLKPNPKAPKLPPYQGWSELHRPGTEMKNRPRPRRRVPKSLQIAADYTPPVCEWVRKLGQTLLKAVKAGSLNDVMYVLNEGADPNYRPSPVDWTPLHIASWYGFSDILLLLLARRAIPRARDASGHTPLHLAAYHEHSGRCVGVLLDGGADVNPRANRGETPLHLAAAYGNLAAVRMLLAGGANRAITNDLGQRAYDVTKDQYIKHLVHP